MKLRALFLIFGLTLFSILVCGRTETQGDKGYFVYHLENAVTKSGKEIPLGWEFRGPRGDPVTSFKITIEGRTEKVEVAVISLAAVNENE
ncbi:MAG: hypothetical protein Q7R92_00040 [bacterium]|nr:hypothetical protein [bacterium]